MGAALPEPVEWSVAFRGRRATRHSTRPVENSRAFCPRQTRRPAQVPR